jgi:hypothetical protein
VIHQVFVTHVGPELLALENGFQAGMKSATDFSAMTDPYIPEVIKKMPSITIDATRIAKSHHLRLCRSGLLLSWYHIQLAENIASTGTKSASITDSSASNPGNTFPMSHPVNATANVQPSHFRQCLTLCTSESLQTQSRIPLDVSYMVSSPTRCSKEAFCSGYKSLHEPTAS